MVGKYNSKVMARAAMCALAVVWATVAVAGSVKGDILAGETIELDASATVEGDITAPRIR